MARANYGESRMASQGMGGHGLLSTASPSPVFGRTLATSFAGASASYASALQWHSYCVFKQVKQAMNNAINVGFLDQSILFFPPEWIKSALVLALITVWMVIGLFTYMNYAARRPHLSLWTVGWMFYSVYLAASIGLEESPHTPLLATNMLFGDCAAMNYRLRLCPPTADGCARCVPDTTTRQRRAIV